MGVFLFPPAAAAGSEYLRFADATELGSSGAISDVSTDQIDLAIIDTQAAQSGGLDSLIGAAVWDLGATSTGNINCLVEWVALPNWTNVVIAVWRAASAPTSLADIDGASSHFLQLLTRSTTPSTSPFLKTGSASLGTLNSSALESSVSCSYVVGCDADGYGGAMSRHDGAGTSKTKTLTTVFTASGNFYLALLWSKAVNAATEAETISLKLQGEFLQ